MLGTILTLIFFIILIGGISEGLSGNSRPVPVKTDWSPETLAAVERKKQRDAMRRVVNGGDKHPDNPLSW